MQMLQNPGHKQILWSNKKASPPHPPTRGGGRIKSKKNQRSDWNTKSGHKPEWGMAPWQTGWLSANRNVTHSLNSPATDKIRDRSADSAPGVGRLLAGSTESPDLASSFGLWESSMLLIVLINKG